MKLDTYSFLSYTGSGLADPYSIKQMKNMRHLDAIEMRSWLQIRGGIFF